MIEDLQEKISRTWSEYGATIIDEIMKPCSTNLTTNPFDYVPNNLHPSKVTPEDLNNFPLWVEGGLYRRLKRDQGQSETNGQYFLRHDWSGSYEDIPESVIGFSLKFIHSTRREFYSDIDNALKKNGISSEQLINAGLGSHQAREIMLPAYLELRSIGYNHIEFAQ